MLQFSPTKYMAKDDFSEPPRRADSKNPIFVFCRLQGSGARRSVPVGLGSSQRAVSTPPPPPEAKARPNRVVGQGRHIGCSRVGGGGPQPPPNR